MPESTDITTINSNARATEARTDTGTASKSVAPDANAAATTAAARSRSFARGVICALIGGALWGLSGACSQFLLSNYDITPLFITCVRMAGSGILLLALLLATRRDTLRRMVRDRTTVRQLALFGIGGLFLCQITYVVAISYTNAGTATVLQSTATVVIMAVTCAKARKLPSKSEAVGLACALAAVWFIATQGNPGAIMLPALGLIWGAANALSVSFYIMYPRRLFARWGSLPTTGCGMIIGGIAALLTAFCVMGGLFSEGIDLTEEKLIGAIVVGTGLPMVCTEQTILKDYFEEKESQGFDFAYRYPGMNKVMQAGGRVIRTAADRGIILLLDDRFLRNDYQALFPREWQDYQVVNVRNVREKIEACWSRTGREESL